MRRCIYSDDSFNVELDTIRSIITVQTRGCGDYFQFYYWNLSNVLKLFTRRHNQNKEIRIHQDFKSIVYHNYLCSYTISKFINSIHSIIKEYLVEQKLLIDKKDFEYSNLKDKPIGLIKYLCKKHKIEL